MKLRTGIHRGSSGSGSPESAPGDETASDPAHWLTRRRAGLLLASIAASSLAGWGAVRAGSFFQSPKSLFKEAEAAVLPKAGVRSRIALRDSILRLVAEGVIDPERFASVYADRGGMPITLKYQLLWPSYLPIHLTAENAQQYVNLLWPIGLANRMEVNEKSPVNGTSLFSFASTAGWALGREGNGGVYFNRFRIVDLSPGQEALVKKVAENTFRPCCNNSTFFQDCNHGSALLGLLQLGASQRLSEAELYNEALAFNSFWFPQNYVQTAVYFKVIEDKDWAALDPRMIMGARYSALGPWQTTVGAKLAEVPDLLPAPEAGVSCGT